MSFPQMNSTQTSNPQTSNPCLHKSTPRNQNGDEAQPSLSGQVAGYIHVSKILECEQKVATLLATEKLQDKKIQSATSINFLGSSCAKDAAKSGSQRASLPANSVSGHAAYHNTKTTSSDDKMLAQIYETINSNKAEIQALVEKGDLTPFTSTGHTGSSGSPLSFERTFSLEASEEKLFQENLRLKLDLHQQPKFNQYLLGELKAQLIKYHDAIAELDETRASAVISEHKLNAEIEKLNADLTTLANESEDKTQQITKLQEKISVLTKERK